MVTRNLLSLILYLAPSLLARFSAGLRGLPGLDFDSYGRLLALRELVAQISLSGKVVKALINPVSCVRYFEMAYVASIVDELLSAGTSGQYVLDISSPRLLPFWMVERAGLEVCMVNPDREDLELSKDSARHVRNNEKLDFVDNVDATRLPFEDDRFDMATSISVIEHVPDPGDMAMIAELRRVVRAGGKIVLSFPVMPEFHNEYRDKYYYNMRHGRKEGGRYFFQRYYDHASIAGRLLSCDGVVEEGRQYWVETPEGWFQSYERRWIRNGLKQTFSDPALMSKHFVDNGGEHPDKGMGICCMKLIVDK